MTFRINEDEVDLLDIFPEDDEGPEDDGEDLVEPEEDEGDEPEEEETLTTGNVGKGVQLPLGVPEDEEDDLGEDEDEPEMDDLGDEEDEDEDGDDLGEEDEEDDLDFGDEEEEDEGEDLGDEEEEDEDDEEEEPVEGNAERIAVLSKFRRSPTYAKYKADHPEQESYQPRVAAAAMVEAASMGMDTENIMRVLTGRQVVETYDKAFVDSVILSALDAGYEPSLVEVETEPDGDVAYVYMDDRVERQLEDILRTFEQVGEPTLERTPDDDPALGLFVFKVRKVQQKDAVSV